MTQTLCNSTSTSVQWVVFETVIDIMYRQDEAIGLQGMSSAEGGGPRQQTPLATSKGMHVLATINDSVHLAMQVCCYCNAISEGIMDLCLCM